MYAKRFLPFLQFVLLLYSVLLAFLKNFKNFNVREARIKRTALRNKQRRDNKKKMFSFIFGEEIFKKSKKLSNIIQTTFD